MKCLPVVDNTHMEGIVSQISDIGFSFYFMVKTGKPECTEKTNFPTMAPLPVNSSSAMVDSEWMRS